MEDTTWLLSIPPQTQRTSSGLLSGRPSRRQPRSMTTDYSDSQDDSTDNGDAPGSTQGSAASSDGEEQLWACPFSKWKPLSYQECHAYKLKEVSRVKQHLRRRHKMPLHCDVCSLEFGDEDTMTNHIQARACRRSSEDSNGAGSGGGREWEGVTSEQQEMLEIRMNRNKTKTEQWYSIYEILFPGQPAPASPFVDLELSPQMRSFQKFLAVQGSGIIDQVLQSRIPPQLHHQRDEVRRFSHTLFEQTMPTLLQEYETAQRHHAHPSSTRSQGHAHRHRTHGSVSIGGNEGIATPGQYPITVPGVPVTQGEQVTIHLPVLVPVPVPVEDHHHHQRPRVTAEELDSFMEGITDPWDAGQAISNLRYPPQHHPQQPLVDDGDGGFTAAQGLNWAADLQDNKYYFGSNE